MSDSNSSSNPATPRTTLKLKTAARRPPVEKKTPQIPQQQTNAKLKPGAHWSDEYKARMQADMDALSTR
jgi:hypothetical protein